MVYIGIHGGRFLELSHSVFGHRSGFLGCHAELPAVHLQCQEDLQEKTPLHAENSKEGGIMTYGVAHSWFVRQLKNVLWFSLSMPVWTAIASAGKKCLTAHVTKTALQTPHPIRIGNVRFARARLNSGDTRVVMLKPGQNALEDDDFTNILVNTKLLRSDSLPKNHKSHRTSAGKVVALPHLSTKSERGFVRDTEHGDYQSINQRLGAIARRQIEEDKFAIEDDPQQDPPSVWDFMVAIFYVVFGVIAMAAGLLSIFI
jgi:hypothetical protein